MQNPVLMVMNMKGGVGKTTLAIELAYAIANYYDKNVLLVDFDPQSNLSLALLPNQRYFQLAKEKKTVAGLLLPNVKPEDPFTTLGAIPAGKVQASNFATPLQRWYYPSNPSKKAGRLGLVPGSLDLMRLALNALPAQSETALSARWSAFIANARNEFDCVILDCHPAGSFFTKSALLSSQAVVVPVTSDAYAAAGLGLMRSFIEDWKPAGGAREFFVLFNDAHKQWDPVVEETIRGDTRFATHCLPGMVRHSKLFAKVAATHEPAVMQKGPHSAKIGKLVRDVTVSLVTALQGKGILSNPWS